MEEKVKKVEEYLNYIFIKPTKIAPVQYGTKIECANDDIIVTVYTNNNVNIQGKNSEKAKDLKERIKNILNNDIEFAKERYEENREIMKIYFNGVENEFCDFKQQWYLKEKRKNILHDIICLLNNTGNEDSYLFIGVDENRRVIGVENDPNRIKDDADLQNYFRSDLFEGNLPKIELRTIDYKFSEVDVVVMKKSKNNPPFFLVKDQGDIKAGVIYCRKCSQNTAKNGTADYRTIRELWKQHLKNELN